LDFLRILLIIIVYAQARVTDRPANRRSARNTPSLSLKL